MTFAHSGKRVLLLAMLIQASVFFLQAVHAQTNSVPLQIVVPFAPGGSVDILARQLSPALSSRLGRPVTIANMPGAGGEIGAGAVARSRPDGSSVLLQSVGVTIIQALRKAPAFDVRRDLAPITQAAESPMAIYVNPSLPVHTVRELINYAKENPGKLNFASSGMGSANHLYMELFRAAAGINMVHIMYSGGTGTTMAVVKNEAQVLITDGLGATRKQAEAGAVRALAIALPSRSPLLPDLPTIAESGLPGYEAPYWYGFFTAVKTPADIVQKLNTDIISVLNEVALRDRLAPQGYSVKGSSPAAFKAVVEQEVAKWEKLVKDANIPRE